MFKFNFNEDERIFDLLRTSEKKWCEFYVVLDEKDVFLYWVELLSRPEFMIDVDLKDIQIKEFRNNYRFRVRASGEKENVNRWHDNLKCVSNFLNGNYDLEYITKSNKEEKEN